eukprot:5327911-Amphidinium_carterae.1
MRNSRELMTLARASDQLIRGDTAGSLDTLLQRFKAIETAHWTGGWQVATQMELIPESRVSAVPAAEFRAAVAQE